MVDENEEILEGTNPPRSLNQIRRPLKGGGGITAKEALAAARTIGEANKLLLAYGRLRKEFRGVDPTDGGKRNEAGK